MNEATIERIELKIAFLERANAELSDVVYRQQREIDGLQEQLKALIDQLDELKVAPQFDPDQERPPHY